LEIIVLICITNVKFGRLSQIWPTEPNLEHYYLQFKLISMKKITTFLLCVVFAGGALWAQNVQISGVVTDDADGQPLPGVSVVVKGSSISSSTDVNGRYTLSVPADATLAFSFVGLKTQEQAVAGRAGRTLYRYLNYTLLQQLTWDKNFDKHHIDVLLGHENYANNYVYTTLCKTTEVFANAYEFANVITRF
jgi:hypothetical protein